MTTGIYSLYWEEQDLIYIGQSQNIEIRAKEHISLLTRGKHTNYKVQKAYNLYGLPEHSIIEICDITLCNEAEVYWTKEFNSLNTKQGLNIIEAGQVGWGTNANNSKYSKVQILKVFSMLYKGVYRVGNITDRTNVSKATINDILTGSSHLWLKATWPEKHEQMLTRAKVLQSISSKCGGSFTIISPEGDSHTVSSITEFCKSLNITDTALTTTIRGFARVLDGTRKQYKGWKLNSSL
jgi:group I intron endonuclease